MPHALVMGLEPEGAHGAVVDAMAVAELLRLDPFAPAIVEGTVTLEQAIARCRYQRHWHFKALQAAPRNPVVTGALEHVPDKCSCAVCRRTCVE